MGWADLGIGWVSAQADGKNREKPFYFEIFL
jgi:hypothetical protein